MTGIASRARATVAGFNAKIDVLLQRRRAKRAGRVEPDLPVLNALCGSYRRMSGGLLPVIDEAARLVWHRDSKNGRYQTFARPPARGSVVPLLPPAPKNAPLRAVRRAV
ncbi:MAG TPA: hypothetical protein VKF61_07490 [Candidatus Polarisedimenticolia bacterium]|nr:hypothetical protein [Candidatus Polarisedimenticolia bacterium]